MEGRIVSQGSFTVTTLGTTGLIEIKPCNSDDEISRKSLVILETILRAVGAWKGGGIDFSQEPEIRCYTLIQTKPRGWRQKNNKHRLLLDVEIKEGWEAVLKINPGWVLEFRPLRT